MKYQSRADLLIAAGESIKMQEKAGITPVFKYGDTCWTTTDLILAGEISEIEFPLAVVEGKPVFVGDELYCNDIKVIINDCYKGFTLSKLSWNPPKPKTVMVELLREDAEWCVQSHCAFYNGRLADACRKALDKA